MTLEKLAARLAEIVEDNKSSGREDRNQLPVMVRLSGRGKAKDWWAPIHFASSGMVITDFGQFVELASSRGSIIK